MFGINNCYVIFLVLLLTSCGGGSGAPGAPASRGDFVSAAAISSLTLEELNSLNNRIPHNFTLTPSFGVNTNKLVYKTIDTQANVINASGVLIIPAGASLNGSPIMVFHHGTIIHNEDAPTSSQDVYLKWIGANLASQGYIVLMPDYLGYGDSVGLLHPYLHANSLASSSVDMLRAAKSYLSQQQINTTNKLFITGYSEGGYAALATHKVMESNHAGEFTVTASVPGAGPYDMSTTLNNYLSLDTLPNKVYIAFAFKAYDTIYSLNRIADFFQPPYDNVVNTSFYGDVLDINVDGGLTNVTSDLFTSVFLTAFAEVDGELVFKEKVAENNIYDWTPVAPVRFYHGTNDVIVPIANANKARDTMLVNGADVDVILCPPGSNTHASCQSPYIDYMVSYFNSLL